MRIAFFGGSFDPPHLGHLRIAQAAADRLGLDAVLLAPVGVQPLKRGVGARPAGFADRLAMLRRMVEAAGDRRLTVSELDAPRADGRPNYTFETLEALRAASRAGDEIFLLGGADSLETLPQWHRVRELVASTDLIVAARPGFSIDELLPALLGISSPSRMETPAQTLPGVEQRLLISPESQTQLYFLTDLHEDVSATSIRARVRGEAQMGEGLAPEVLRYIEQHGLYR